MIPQSCRTHLCFHLVGELQDLFAGLSLKFNNQNRTGIALHKKPVLALLDISLGALQNIMVDELAGTGPVFQSNEVGAKRFINVVEMHAQ